jgi:hypothetical protein
LIPGFRALHTTRRHVFDEGSHVIDHEIDFVLTTRIRGMDGDFRRRQREDQPTLTHVNTREAEHVAKKRAIGVGVRAVDDHVCSAD